MVENPDVLRAVLARRGKKIPVDDGRKISLVVFGGAMSAVRGTGALNALAELELTNAFDAVYSFSAGFANAAYFLAGEAPQSTKVYTRELTGRRFINPFKPWQVLNLPYMVKVLEERQVLHPERVWSSPTKLYTYMFNCTKKQNELIEAHPHHDPKEIFTLIKASCDMPFYAPGKVVYQGVPYKDARGYIENFLPMVFEQPMTDFLIIYNRPDQRLKTLTPPANTFELMPPDKNLSWYEVRGHVLSGAARKMHNQVLQVFEKFTV